MREGRLCDAQGEGEKFVSPIRHGVSNHQAETVKRYLPILFAGALVIGAASPARGDHAVGREDLQPATEPQVFDVNQHNHAMKRAVHEARRTVGVFIAALGHPSAGEYDFEVKKPFRQGDVVEHMWLSDVTFSGNRFQGRVDNMPRKIKGLKMGDRVSVNPNEISDWAYVENGRLVGGYTIRVLYWELPPAGREALQKEVRFRIEDHS
jgi:uncharacterized protein YegJ (DUF2314 family)